MDAVLLSLATYIAIRVARISEGAYQRIRAERDSSYDPVFDDIMLFLVTGCITEASPISEEVRDTITDATTYSLCDTLRSRLNIHPVTLEMARAMLTAIDTEVQRCMVLGNCESNPPLCAALKVVFEAHPVN